MISGGYSYSGETGVQLDGENFARRSALTFVGKFESRLEKPGNSLLGNFAD